MYDCNGRVLQMHSEAKLPTRESLARAVTSHINGPVLSISKSVEEYTPQTHPLSQEFVSLVNRWSIYKWLMMRNLPQHRWVACSCLGVTHMHKSTTISWSGYNDTDTRNVRFNTDCGKGFERPISVC